MGNDNIHGDDILHGGDDNDRLYGGSGHNELYGEDGNDILTGGSSNDMLEGGNGNDSLLCGSGDDIANGGAGVDYLSGYNGSDTLNGGAGVDRLYGGADADTFILDADALSGRDTVRDFTIAQGDKLELHDLLAGYDPLTSAITDFLRITDNAINSYVSVDTDGTANGHLWTQIARLDNVLSMTDEAQLLADGVIVIT